MMNETTPVPAPILSQTKTLSLMPIVTGHNKQTGEPYFEEVIVTELHDEYPIALVHVDNFYVEDNQPGDRRIYQLLQRGLIVYVDVVIAMSDMTKQAVAEDESYEIA